MRILTLFTVLALQVFAQSTNLRDATIDQKRGFLTYCARFNRNYGSTQEMDSRFGLYLKTKEMIDNAPPSSFTMALNSFADRTDAEKQALLTLQTESNRKNRSPLGITCPAGQFDNQGVCQRCSTAGCRTCPQNVCSQCYTSNMKLDTTKNVCTCQTGPMNAAKTGCTTCSAGTYFDVNLQTCLKCSSNCAVCSGSTTCTKCNAYYLLKGGSCSCGTSINRAGKCVACASGQYWTGTSCASCSSVTNSCSSCMNTSGKCKTCESPFVLSPTFTCDCPTGQFFDGSTCATIVTCPAGQYRTAQNTCQNCGSDCSTCQELTGKCLTCSTGLVVDSTNPANCINCTYPIGPVGAPVACVDQPYSTTRLVPPYPSTATSVDWRTWGVVSPIQDQGACGSCWAFSTTANTESAYAIATGNLYKYSEQYLVSCETDQLGCNGGWPPYALAYIAQKGTIFGNDYLYISGNTGKNEACLSAGKTFQKPLVGSGYIYPSTLNYTSFKDQLRQGVVDIAFDVQNSFYFYTSGIYQPTTDCKYSSSSSINHAMLAVGFGVENGVEFAIVRNSWGTGWGEQGYVRVALVTKNPGVCALYASFFRANAGF